jgi:predicted acyl esterase
LYHSTARDLEYGVALTHDVPVTTRDGVELATDIYRPTDPETGEPVEEPQPALLYRTPYDKRTRSHIEEQGRYYAARGYVVALQDVRGRFASEGEFYLLKNEAEDGADTVEWLAGRDYCDGQVGTMGTSYMAWTQSALATQDPDGLAAMFVNQGAASAWDAVLRHNGAFELRWLTWAFTLGGPVDPEFTADVVTGESGDPAVQRQLVNTDTGDLLADWPVLAQRKSDVGEGDDVALVALGLVYRLEHDVVIVSMDGLGWACMGFVTVLCQHVRLVAEAAQ